MPQDKLATTLAVQSLFKMDTHAPKPEIIAKVSGLIPHLPPDLGYQALRGETPRNRVIDSICSKARRLHEAATDLRKPSEQALHDLVFDIRLLQQAHAGAVLLEELGSFDGFFLTCEGPYDSVQLYRDGDCLGDDAPLVSMDQSVTRAEILAVIKGWRAGYDRGASDGADEVRVGMKRLLQIA